jgi:UDP-glucose:(heptosyl)LPS alpha-1,3-glucosyltransferase
VFVTPPTIRETWLVTAQAGHDARFRQERRVCVVRAALVYHAMRLDAGIPKMHAQLARYLAGRGYDVHVYGNLADSDPSLANGATFHDVGLSARVGRLAEPATSVRFMRRVQAMVRADVVHGRGVSCWDQDIAHVTGLYRSEQSGELWDPARRGVARRIKDLLQPVLYPMGSLRAVHERRLARDPHTLIHAETSAVKEALTEHHAIDPERVRVVVPGVDTVTFSPEGARARLNLVEPVIAFCGHDYRRKGLDLVLLGMARMRTRASLVVIGGGMHLGPHWGDEATGPFEQLAAQLGLADRVRFLGARSDVASCLRAAHVLAHPARFDVWALAVVEGMSTGLPVVVSKTTGAAELVGPHNGHVLESGSDADELARALDGLLEPSRRARAGDAARKAAEKVSVERQGALVETDMLRIAEEKARLTRRR